LIEYDGKSIIMKRVDMKKDEVKNDIKIPSESLKRSIEQYENGELIEIDSIDDIL